MEKGQWEPGGSVRLMSYREYRKAHRWNGAVIGVAVKHRFPFIGGISDAALSKDIQSAMNKLYLSMIRS